MAIPIPSPLIEFVLLGPLDDRRQLQDSPILGDVWVAFGKEPAGRQDLLIVPYRTAHPGAVAGIIEKAILDAQTRGTPGPKDKSPLSWEVFAGADDKAVPDDGRNVAYIQGLVVARLSFSEMLTIVVPKTRWWIAKWPKQDKENPDGARNSSDDKHEALKFMDTAEEVIDRMLTQARAWNEKLGIRDFVRDHPDKLKSFTSFERFLTLMGLILWAGALERSAIQLSRLTSRSQIS